MFDRYDIKFLTSPLTTSGNILIHLQTVLADHLNKTTKLPRLLIVLLDKDFIHLGDATHSDVVIRSLVSSLFTSIQIRKEQLDRNAKRSSEPKFIFVKPTPKYNLINIDEDHRNMKWAFNRGLEKTIHKYEEIFTANIDAIIPSDGSFYEKATGGGLSIKGYKLYWMSLIY